MLSDLSDIQALQLLRAMLAVKFDSQKSTDFLGIDIFNRIISDILDRHYDSEIIEKSVDYIRQDRGVIGYFPAVIDAISLAMRLNPQMLENMGLSNAVKHMCFPYKIDEGLEMQIIVEAKRKMNDYEE